MIWRSSGHPWRAWRRIRRLWAAGALALAAAVGLLAPWSWTAHPVSAALIGGGSGNGGTQGVSGSDDGPAPVSPDAAGKFEISGSVKGLYPGATLPLVLTVTNHLAFAISVGSLTVAVGNADSACTSANVTISAFSGGLIVPKHGTATTTLHITLLHSAPNACQGAAFPLSYSGQATKA